MSEGKFIAFEGGEGVGKTTQMTLLADALEKRGIKAVTTREPGGTSGAEVIRRLLLATDGDGWNPRAEALLFAAARSDHVERLIRPALGDGKWVICDRFIDSSRAYQGGGGGLADAEIMTLHGIGSQGLMPDLTLLIEVDPRQTRERTAERDGESSDRIGGRDAGYHERVAAKFASIADAEAARFARIDGNGSREETHARIMTAMAPLLEGNA